MLAPHPPSRFHHLRAHPVVVAASRFPLLLVVASPPGLPAVTLVVAIVPHAQVAAVSAAAVALPAQVVELPVVAVPQVALPLQVVVVPPVVVVLPVAVAPIVVVLAVRAGVVGAEKNSLRWTCRPIRQMTLQSQPVRSSSNEPQRHKILALV